MSKYMQIDVRVIPFFEKSLERHFPRISDLLKKTYYSKVISEEPSLYNLVDYLVSVSRDQGSPPEIRDKIRPYATVMLELKKSAREHLLAGRLYELDQLLYRIEDQFEDLEDSL